ncbi:MAG TPA: FAD-dependent oxidoreductase, partial [Phycisphaerae bacterium]|nr:FAD-dependent oxidoreductase [Phycisphaerae bacterium]
MANDIPHFGSILSTCRLLILIALLGLIRPTQAGEAQHDVVVYGGTAGGVMAGVAAARQGASVIIIEPGKHVGGMVSGGLGHTDVVGLEKLIGGLALEFFRRAGKHYGQAV